MRNKAVAIHARVSTDKQKVDMQLQELRELVKRSRWKLHKNILIMGTPAYSPDDSF